MNFVAEKYKVGEFTLEVFFGMCAAKHFKFSKLNSLQLIKDAAFYSKCMLVVLGSEKVVLY